MFAKFDENGNCVHYGVSKKINENYLEIGTDINWIIDIIRQGSTMTINVKNMKSDDEVLYCYSEKDKIKKDGNTIRLKTELELKQDKYEKLKKEITINIIKKIIDVISFQNVVLSKGSNIKNSLFTDKQIKEWGDYILKILKNDIDLSKSNNIDISIFGDMPELPESLKYLLEGK
jgi:hypothetical protein